MAYFRRVILLVDNYDSFTFNLKDYFLQLGEEVRVQRNNEVDFEAIEAEAYSGIVLSPGPGTPDDAGLCMEILDRYVEQVPFFGVCLGMQAIHQHFGGQLSRAAYPMHGKVSRIEHQDHLMFEGAPASLEVCRYHSLICVNLPSEHLLATAKSELEELMAVAHHKLPVWGVQFHPEAILTPFGKQILANWIKRINLQLKP